MFYTPTELSEAKRRITALSIANQLIQKEIEKNHA